jgi:diguanylate cyclase (GGDEF)-like protein/PAS domain S-box-containing protein
VDRNRVVTYWNAGAAGIAGYSAEDMVGHACYENRLSHVDDQGRLLCSDGCPLRATIEDGITREIQVYLKHRDGHRVPVRVQAWPLRDDQGAIVGAVEVFQDDTANRHARDRMASLERDALIDQVTGVGNRRFADAMLATHLAESSRLGWSFGIMLVDVDGFKQINDQYGHLVGDRTLKTVATTMVRAIRSYDQVARWGGDEFLVVTRGLDDARLLVLGERLRTLVAASRIQAEDGGELSVTVSVGLARAMPEDDAESLLGRADAALYASKARGRNTVTAG